MEVILTLTVTEFRSRSALGPTFTLNQGRLELESPGRV
jgi:hypothetical protein